MKKGTPVKVLVKGAEVTGKVVAVNKKPNGEWVEVNINPEGKPKEAVIKTFRIGAVKTA